MAVQLKEQVLLKELLSELPSLNNQLPLEYPRVDIDTMIAEVGQCLGAIQSHRQTPSTFTSYSDLFPILDRLETQLETSAGFGSGPELMALARAESNGVDPGFSGSASEMGGFSKNTWSAGLQLRIPLDSSEYSARSTRQKLARLEISQQKAQLRRMLDATHSSAVESIGHLLSTIRNLRSSTEYLKERMASVEKKYRQGRVDLLSLVQEQDQLYSAENSLTESRLLFLQELLSYFMVFDKTPCAFNLQHDKVLGL